jgi:hypothetical protein
MIARFDAIEQLAADFAWRRGGSKQPTNRQPVSGGKPCSWKPAVLGQRVVVRKVKKRFDGLSRPTFRSASAP